MNSYDSTPIPNVLWKASVLLVNSISISLDKLIAIDEDHSFLKKSFVPRILDTTHTIVWHPCLGIFAGKMLYYSLLGPGISLYIQAAFIPTVPDPSKPATIDGYFYFIHNRQFIQIARIGNIVARLGDKNTSFPNMCYLLEHTDVYLVTFFELADCNIIGYLPNMIPNVLVFLFIIRALFLLSLINATIMVIVFWRRGI